MFNQFQILINNNQVNMGSLLPPTIHQFSVTLHPMTPVRIPTDQTPLVKQWLNNIINNLSCDYVEYNNILIPVTELVKFKL